MPLIIEDGSIVAGANTFISEAELSAYLTDRGYSLPASSEPLLIRSYDLMRALPWCDSHASAFSVTSDIKNGQAEIAYRFGTGFDPYAVVDGNKIKREQVDVLSVEYFAANASTGPYSTLEAMPQAKAWLDGLLCDSGSTLLRS